MRRQRFSICKVTKDPIAKHKNELKRLNQNMGGLMELVKKYFFASQAALPHLSLRGMVISFSLIALILISGCGRNNPLVFTGTIESTQIDANAEVTGKIIRVEKEEGDVVEKGDVLAVVDPTTQENIVKQYEAAVKFKQARLDELKAGTRIEQIRQAEAAARAARATADGASTNIRTAQINREFWLDKYNRMNNLFQSRLISLTEFQDAQNKLENADQQLQAARESLKSSESQFQSAAAQLDLFRKGATAQSIRAAEADLDQATAVQDQAKTTLAKCEIRSPISGTLSTRNINIGDMVNIGSSVGSITDLSDIWVKIYIPRRHMELVSLNQQVPLKMFDKTIHGKINFIASEAEFTPRNVETTEAKENQVFKAKIKIIDHLAGLKPGMTVDASIPARRDGK